MRGATDQPMNSSRGGASAPSHRPRPPEEEGPVHLVRLVVVALLDAGTQLALHALDATTVAGAVAGTLLLCHRRRRRRRHGPALRAELTLSQARSAAPPGFRPCGHRTPSTVAARSLVRAGAPWSARHQGRRRGVWRDPPVSHEATPPAGLPRTLLAWAGKKLTGWGPRANTRPGKNVLVFTREWAGPMSWTGQHSGRVWSVYVCGHCTMMCACLCVCVGVQSLYNVTSRVGCARKLGQRTPQCTPEIALSTWTHFRTFDLP